MLQALQIWGWWYHMILSLILSTARSRVCLVFPSVAANADQTQAVRGRVYAEC